MRINTIAVTLAATIALLQLLMWTSGSAQAEPAPAPRASITHVVEGGCFQADGWTPLSTYSGSFAIPQFDASLGTLVAVEVECLAECGWTMRGKALGSGCSGDWRMQMAKVDNFAAGEVHLGARKLDASGTQQIPATLSGSAPVGAPGGFPCDFLNPSGVIVLQQPVTALGNGSSSYTDAPLLAAVTGSGTITLDLTGMRQMGVSTYIPCASLSSCVDLLSQVCPTGASGGGWQIKASVTYHYQ